MKRPAARAITAILLLAGLLLSGCLPPEAFLAASSATPGQTASPAPTDTPRPPATATAAPTDTPTPKGFPTPAATVEIPTKGPFLPPSISPTPARTSQLVDLTYAGQLWALVSVADYGYEQTTLVDLRLEGSKDGGKTWEARSIPAVQSATEQKVFLSNKLAFLDENTGWLYDPFAPILYQTQDGGQTWKEIQTSGAISAILPAQSAGEQSWALASSCTADELSCTYQLESLDPKSGALTAVTGYAPLQAGHYPPPRLARLGQRTALVFGLEPGSDASQMGLWAASGTSSQWKLQNTPCHQYGVFSLGPDGQLWLECGSVDSGADEAKAFYTSANQGASWELRSATDFLFTATPPSDHPLGVHGTVVDLLALSQQEALTALGQGTLYFSTDQARNWLAAAVPPDVDGSPDSFGWILVRKPGSDEVWAAAVSPPPIVQTRLLHSTDRGRTWSDVQAQWR